MITCVILKSGITCVVIANRRLYEHKKYIRCRMDRYGNYLEKSPMLAAFIKDSELSQSEISELKELLNKKEEEIGNS
jgi:predicted transcriptional regulator